MRKGILTMLILMATVFCAARSVFTNKTPVIHHTGNSGLTDVSAASRGKDTSNVTARQATTCGTYTVTDADGNVYSTVLIGDQCWMAENLRVGVMIPGTTPQANDGIIEKHCYGDNPSNCITYGGLYQWNELMQYSGQQGTQGICPSGWHIPTDGQWQWLATILAVNTGGAMKTTGTIEGGTGLWYAPNTAATNSSGFNAVPGGWKDDAGNFGNLGYNAFFFSSTPWWYCCAHFRQLSYINDWFVNSWTSLGYSMSVRCLKNAATLPTVSTSSISGITATTALGGGSITDDGGADITARGVVWSTTHNPTIISHEGITMDGSEVGVFTSNLTGLAPHTTYYVKAYATNSIGTAYGMEVEFMTAVPSILTLSGLIINAGTDTCFNASQTINVSNVTVQTGGSATFIAGGNILLQPATNVANGGYLRAYITTNQNYCLQPAGMLQLNNEKAIYDIQTTDLRNASVLFSIFPNPSTACFTLEMHEFDAIQTIQVEICSMMGERVLQTELPGRQRYEFDLTGWPEGVYLIRVIAGDKMSVGKLLKQ